MQTPESPPRIDVQHHVLPGNYIAAVGAEAIGKLIVSGRVPDWSAGQSIEAMDRNGIELAVTSISAPAFDTLELDASIALARACNEFAASLCADYPGRFGMFASLPMPDIAASLREIEYSLDTLRADGICMMTSYGGRYLGDESFRELFEEINRRRIVVHVHPVATDGPICLPGIPAATLDFPFDTTRTAVSLLFNGTLSRFRDMRLILSHAGGTIPYLYDRIARLERRPEFRSAVPDGAIAELRRLYFDTALSASENIFASLRTLVGAENILFASDYPFAPEDTMRATVMGLDRLNLTRAERALIHRENALTLMPSLREKLHKVSGREKTHSR